MKIGRHSYIGSTGSDISASVTIGNYTSIAPYVQMHSRTQHACIADPALVSTSPRIPGYPDVSSRDTIVIGSDVWIGRNAVLLGGITIGHGAIIGAYAVVAKDVPPFAIVVGNPCVIKRYRFGPKQIDKLLRVQWWEWDDATIAARRDDLRRIDVFLHKYG